MGVERYAFLGNVAQLGKAEHLKSAAVGQDRAVPAGKLVQAAHIGNDLITGTQVEMIGVAQHDLCADLFQIMCRKPALDRGSSGNVLESRCLNRAVHSLELAAAGCTLFFNQAVWHKWCSPLFCHFILFKNMRRQSVFLRRFVVLLYWKQ